MLVRSKVFRIKENNFITIIGRENHTEFTFGRKITKELEEVNKNNYNVYYGIAIAAVIIGFCVMEMMK